jgi:hypothetical protein
MGYAALKSAIEAAYPPKHTDYKTLTSMDLPTFLSFGIGDQIYTKLSLAISTKISDMVHDDSFDKHWEPSTRDGEAPKWKVPNADVGNSLMQSPVFRSVVIAAQTFEILRWMF